MSESKKIVIEITPMLNGEEFKGEYFDPTPLLIKFISSINTIPPRGLKDYGPVFPMYKADCPGGIMGAEGSVWVTHSDLTLIYNGS